MLQDALASSRTRSRRKDKINNQLYRIDQARCADDRRGRPSNDQRDFILNASAGELVRAMKDFGSAPVPVDATKVMQAFIQQSHDAHRAFNCLTEIMMTEALKQAWAIDDTSGSDSKENDANDAHGLLHGLPVSLKDCINVRGHDSTLGLTKACGEGDAGNVEDALIVTLLREAGAIPFVKTNVPQTMISFECRNPLFGTTTNPWNIDHTPGGSSGGEGCLLVARGSPLGFGTDIGGSVRIPAHFSGCCALKPTSRRVTKVCFTCAWAVLHLHALTCT